MAGAKGRKWIITDKTLGEKAKTVMADYKADVKKLKEIQKRMTNDYEDDNPDDIDEAYSLTESLSLKTVDLMEACVNLLSGLEADQRVMHERLRKIEEKLEGKE